jgi:hypothetical protein
MKRRTPNLLFFLLLSSEDSYVTFWTSRTLLLSMKTAIVTFQPIEDSYESTIFHSFLPFPFPFPPFSSFPFQCSPVPLCIQQWTTMHAKLMLTVYFGSRSNDNKQPQLPTPFQLFSFFLSCQVETTSSRR